ncbi:MAG: Hpt domain-containing protein [Bryobacterales bacterium]
MKLLSKAEPDAAPNGRTTRDHQGISRRERGEFNQLDHDFVELEQRPEDHDLLSSIFRTIHTMKGTCGFLGFEPLKRSRTAPRTS